MKRFKSKTTYKLTGIKIFLISVLLCYFLNIFNKNISNKINSIIDKKLTEISTLIIKKDITPIEYDLNKLIDINYKNDEISYVDINSNYAYQILYEKVKTIQNNIELLEKGEFTKDSLLKTKDNNVYLLINLGLSNKGVLFPRFGPKIPIKVDFYENVLGTFDVEIEEYGINNALLKCYLTITLNREILIPFTDKKTETDYKMLLGSKMITGTIPNIYGTNINKRSSFEVGV